MTKKELYERKPGDLEIRILRDGRVVVLAPDEDVLDIAEHIDPENIVLRRRREARSNARKQSE